jgi:hypothetical protein
VQELGFSNISLGYVDEIRGNAYTNSQMLNISRNSTLGNHFHFVSFVHNSSSDIQFGKLLRVLVPFTFQSDCAFFADSVECKLRLQLHKIKICTGSEEKGQFKYLPHGKLWQLVQPTNQSLDIDIKNIKGACYHSEERYQNMDIVWLAQPIIAHFLCAGGPSTLEPSDPRYMGNIVQ